MAANGGRAVVVYLPPRFDPRQDAHLLTFFHGHRWDCSDDLRARGVLGRLRHLGDQVPQMVFICPSTKGAEGFSYWMNRREKESYRRLIEQALAEAARLAGVDKLRVATRVVSAHSGGGRALRNIVNAGEMQADHLELLDMFYSDWATTTARWAAKAGVAMFAVWTPHRDRSGRKTEDAVDEVRRLVRSSLLVEKLAKKGDHNRIPKWYVGARLGAPASTATAPASEPDPQPEAPRPAASGEKPQAVRLKAFCNSVKTCKPYCDGAKPNREAVRGALERLGYQKPSDLVDPAIAIQDELRRLGCAPAGAKNANNASKNCGIRFDPPTKERALLPAVVRGLAEAAL
jgi:hypothetical protein